MFQFGIVFIFFIIGTHRSFLSLDTRHKPEYFFRIYRRDEEKSGKFAGKNVKTRVSPFRMTRICKSRSLVPIDWQNLLPSHELSSRLVSHPVQSENQSHLCTLNQRTKSGFEFSKSGTRSVSRFEAPEFLGTEVEILLSSNPFLLFSAHRSFGSCFSCHNTHFPCSHYNSFLSFFSPVSQQKPILQSAFLKERMVYPSNRELTKFFPKSIYAFFDILRSPE